MKIPVSVPDSSSCSLESQLQYDVKTVDCWLTGRLKKWQSQFPSLGDWNITVNTVPPQNLKQKTLGGIHWDSDKHIANIYVLHPAHYKKTQVYVVLDTEYTVVHELLHLDTAKANNFPALSKAEKKAEEKEVNRRGDRLFSEAGHGQFIIELRGSKSTGADRQK